MAKLLRKWWRRWADEHRAARARRELQALSDYTLRDIGLTRDQIDALFR